MFRLHLFRIRAFSAGNVANLLGALGRGGLQFMLIIWLQGIWLPAAWLQLRAHPAVGGHLHGPSDRRLPHRRTGVGDPVGSVRRPSVCHRGHDRRRGAFVLLELLPINFGYVWFALALLLMGLAMGMFASPNRAAVMNSLPPDQRGAGAGMMTTFQNAAQVLSIGVFFSVITLGLAASLPAHLYTGLVAQGVPASTAQQVAGLPPVGSLFAAFLGYNPIQQLIPASVLAHLPAGHAAYLTGRSFFPSLDQPGVQDRAALRLRLRHRLFNRRRHRVVARGGRYVHEDPVESSAEESGARPATRRYGEVGFVNARQANVPDRIAPGQLSTAE